MFKHTVSTCYTSEYTKDIIHTSSPPVPTYYSHGHTGALLSDRGTPCLPLLLSCCCDHKAQVRVPSWVSVPLVSSLPPSSTLPNEGRALCSRGACSQQPGQKAWPPAHHDRRQSNPDCSAQSSSGRKMWVSSSTAPPWWRGRGQSSFQWDHQSDFHMRVVTIPDTFAPLIFSNIMNSEHFSHCQ